MLLSDKQAVLLWLNAMQQDTHDVLDGCSLTRCLRPDHDVDTDTACDVTEIDLDSGDGWNVTVKCKKSGTVVLAKCNAPGQPCCLTGC